MSNTVISLRNVVKKFRTDKVETTALGDVTLDVGAGEFVAIMGPSGCGKSTLLNVLGLLDRSDAGSVKLLDTDTTALSERKRTSFRCAHLGFIFQSFNLIEELTVRQNIELALKYRRIHGEQARSRCNEVMEQLDIAKRGDHQASQLSGGQRQRVAIARAIVNRPDILLADEPTGNLDDVNRSEVLDILDGLNRAGSAIVMVTHSQSDAARAQRTIRLSEGRVVAGAGITL